jgi:hypothetical protein
MLDVFSPFVSNFLEIPATSWRPCFGGEENRSKKCPVKFAFLGMEET